MIPVLFYYQWSKTQRNFGIACVTCFISWLSTYPAVRNAFMQYQQMKQQYQASVNQQIKQTELIIADRSVEKKLQQQRATVIDNKTENHLKTIAHQMGVMDIQKHNDTQIWYFTASNDQLYSWMRAISALPDAPKIMMLEINNDANNEIRTITLATEADLPFFRQETTLIEHGQENIIVHSRLVGILRQGAFCFAFLQLPDQSLISLSMGQPIPQTSWVVHTIEQKVIVLENQKSQEMLRKELA